MFVQLVYKCLNFPINEDFLQYQLQHLNLSKSETSPHVKKILY